MAQNSNLHLGKLSRASTAIVLGSGGHTAEMLSLLSRIDRERFGPRSYYVAQTDTFSINKLREFEQGRTDYEVVSIPRAREVGQSYFTSIFTTIKALLVCLVLVFWKPADLLLVNGPGTCLPVCLAYLLTSAPGQVLNQCGVKNARKLTQIVFVESICRVKTLSMTGHCLRWIASSTLVQWPELAEKYSGTSYIGKLL